MATAYEKFVNVNHYCQCLSLVFCRERCEERRGEEEQRTGTVEEEQRRGTVEEEQWRGT